MSDQNPTVTDLPSGVDPVQEDNSISEDQIKGADLEVSQDNIVEGERSNKGGVSNYAEADDKADKAVEAAGISAD